MADVTCTECFLASIRVSKEGGEAERFKDQWPLPKDRDWNDSNNTDKSERRDGSQANKVTKGQTAQDLDGK